MKRILLFVLCGFILLSCSAQNKTADNLTLEQKANIYAAVVRQNVTVDDTFGGNLKPLLIYIVRQTNDAIGDPNVEALESVVLVEELQNQITNQLTDLEAAIIWVNDRVEVEIEPDTGRVAKDGVIVTLGNIHPQEDGTVLVSSSIYIAGLAAGGQTYILEQVDGQWIVSGHTGVQWIS